MRYGRGAAPTFPVERDAKRAALLAAVESVRAPLEANRDEAELLRTLPTASVEAMRDAGLFGLKLPTELGGAEADPIVQMDVIEAITRIDPAAGWCMFITGAVAGSASARLPDEAIDQIFATGRFPSFVGTLKPNGTATRVDGGYRITGRWSWGSGLGHADWVSVLSFADDPKTVVSACVPISDVTVHDTWHVMGMKGTGSADYSLEDVFVPDVFVTDTARPVQQRGGPLYRLGMPGFVVNEHAIFPLALAGRMLDDLITLAIEKKRGYGSGTTTADRAIVQRLVSESTLRLRACRLLADDVLGRLLAAATDGPPHPALQAEARAAAVRCTDEAIEIATAAFRHAGGSAVYLDHMMQRCLRDLMVIQSHFVVDDSAYEQHGALLLGVSDKASMS